MSRKTRSRIGVSETVSAVISFALIAMLLAFLVTHIPKPMLPSTAPATEIVNSLAESQVLIIPSNDGVNVINNGPRDLSIEFVLYRNLDSNSIGLSYTEKPGQCNVANNKLKPGENTSVVCSPNTLFVGIISAEGNTYTIDPKFYSVQPTSSIINQTVLLSSKVASNLFKYLEDPQLLWEGAVLTSGIPSLIINLTGMSVAVDLRLHVSLLIIGRNEDNSSWNLLAVGHMNRKDIITYPSNILGRTFRGQRFRLKIENLTADSITLNGNAVRPGIYPCSLFDGQCTLRVKAGNANTIRLYVWKASDTATFTTGLDPYIISADTDENGYQELFLVTQDFTIGGISEINDVNPANNDPAIEKTAHPVRIIFTDVPINNSVYSTAVVSARIRYWDNSVDGIVENNNLPIVTVGLYDIKEGKYVYKTELSYYELARYRGFPFSMSRIVKDFLLRVPPPELTNGSKIYYIAIDIVDPYWLTVNIPNYTNDADIVASIEYVGLVLGGRT